MDFPFFLVSKMGKTGGFFVKWLPRSVCITPALQFSHIGNLVGRQDLGFHEFSRPATIYQIIFELNPFKSKFLLELHKLHFNFFRDNTWRFPEGLGP
jgi:hypothetical protein